MIQEPSSDQAACMMKQHHGGLNLKARNGSMQGVHGGLVVRLMYRVAKGRPPGQDTDKIISYIYSSNGHACAGMRGEPSQSGRCSGAWSGGLACHRLQRASAGKKMKKPPELPRCAGPTLRPACRSLQLVMRTPLVRLPSMLPPPPPPGTPLSPVLPNLCTTP